MKGLWKIIKLNFFYFYKYLISLFGNILEKYYGKIIWPLLTRALKMTKNI